MAQELPGALETTRILMSCSGRRGELFSKLIKPSTEGLCKSLNVNSTLMKNLGVKKKREREDAPGPPSHTRCDSAVFEWLLRGRGAPRRRSEVQRGQTHGDATAPCQLCHRTASNAAAHERQVQKEARQWPPDQAKFKSRCSLTSWVATGESLAHSRSPFSRLSEKGKTPHFPAAVGEPCRTLHPPTAHPAASERAETMEESGHELREGRPQQASRLPPAPAEPGPCFRMSLTLNFLFGNGHRSGPTTEWLGGSDEVVSMILLAPRTGFISTCLFPE